MMNNTMMNTIVTIITTNLASKDIHVDASAETILTMVSWDDIKAMGKEARSALYSYALERADADEWWDVSHMVGRYIDEEYYHDNFDAFMKYKARMNEPDFDWDFYSDWHKDMYGYRPR